MNTRIFAAAVVALTLTADGAAAQTRLRAATAAELSSSLEATTALVSPAVVEIFTTSYAPGEGLVPRTPTSSPRNAHPDPGSSSTPTATS